MKNYIKKFKGFINEEVEDSVTQNKNRDRMVYLIPRTYRIVVELNSEFTSDNQSRGEGILTRKMSRFNSNKIDFTPGRGVNISGNKAYFRIKTVFTKEDIKNMLTEYISEEIGGELNIEEVPNEDFHSNEYLW